MSVFFYPDYVIYCICHLANEINCIYIIFFQYAHKQVKRHIQINKVIKAILYGVLLINAVYWAIKGEFIDGWDAFLWLIAFVFIEMNVFGWDEGQATEAIASE